MKVIFELPRALPTDVPDQVAAPAPVMSWKSTLVRETAAAVMVRVVPSTLEKTRSLFIALLPDTVKVEVVVGLPEKLRVEVLLAPAFQVKLAKVSLPETVNCEAVALVIVKLLNVNVPKVLDKPPFTENVDVLALKVKLEPEKLTPLLPTVIVDAPRVRVLVPAPPTVKLDTVTVFPFVSKVPVERVRVLLLEDILSCNVQPPPEPLNVTLQDKLVPVVVIVFPVPVALKVIVPVADQVESSPRVKLPLTASVAVPANVVIVDAADSTKSRQTAAESIVTVPVPERISKLTLSEAVGILPLAGVPPELVAQ